MAEIEQQAREHAELPDTVPSRSAKTPDKCCAKSEWRDLSQGIGENRNWYCPNCQAHFYNQKLWRREEWSRWIESALDDQPAACRRCVNAEATGDHYDGFWCGVGEPSGTRRLVLGHQQCMAYTRAAPTTLATVKPKPGPMIPSDRRHLYPQECTNG